MKINTHLPVLNCVSLHIFTQAGHFDSKNEGDKPLNFLSIQLIKQQIRVPAQTYNAIQITAIQKLQLYRNYSYYLVQKHRIIYLSYLRMDNHNMPRQSRYKWRKLYLTVVLVDLNIRIYIYINIGRCRWPRCVRRRSAAARKMRLRVRLPPVAWMSVSCECCVLSGRGLCVGLITHPEESYREISLFPLVTKLRFFGRFRIKHIQSRNNDNIWIQKLCHVWWDLKFLRAWIWKIISWDVTPCNLVIF